MKPRPELKTCGHFALTTEACGICPKPLTPDEQAERDRRQTELDDWRRQLDEHAAKWGSTDPTTALTAPDAVSAAPTDGATKEVAPFVAGIRHMPDGEYHADPLRERGSASLSGTSTRLLLPPHTPAHYRHRMLTPPTPKTAAMILGTAVHAVALGTADLDVYDGKTWTSKDAQAFLAEHDPDDVFAPVLAGDVAAVHAMARNLREHPIGKLILDADGETETAMFAQHPETGIWLRGKTDKLARLTRGRAIICDVKTTGTATGAHPSEFARTVGKYGYDTQGAHYALIAHLLGVVRKLSAVSVVHLIVETAPPYLVSACEVRRLDMDLAREVNEAAYRVFARCMESGEWPGYPSGLREVGLTPWDVRAREDAIEAIEEGDPS